MNTAPCSPGIRWHAGILVLGVLILTPHVFSQVLEDVPKETNGQSILEFRIDSFRVEHGDMEQALRTLRRLDYSRILIGFEKAPVWWEGKEGQHMSLNMTNTTVGAILNRLCEIDPRYRYEVIENVLVNVFPKEAKSDKNDLLNIHIRRFSVHERRTPDAVIKLVANYAPELREYFAKRRREYSQKTEVSASSPGVSTTGNMDPEIQLEFENMTVREILNAIVLYSLHAHREGKPDPTGWKPLPVSWKYEFVIKPDAATGLGGFPKWDVIN